MDIRHIWQEHRTEPGSAVTAWIVAAAMLVAMQGAVLLADPATCTTGDQPARAEKSGLDGRTEMADDVAALAGGARYYRCFERQSETRNGSFVIGLACVWPAAEGSGG